MAPLALDYLARVTAAPRALKAKVVDGDQRMWLEAPADETVVVLDYRQAPYLRFLRRGVEVNHNSAMYYLNQTPVAQTPPVDLGPATPPRWIQATTGHAYEWHDGRLHALASQAVAPGTAFVGRWRIPVLVGGHLESIAGALWHDGPPSIVWFWPIAVLLLCLLALWRLKRPRLERRAARVVALAALAAVATIALGRELHGRPTVSVVQNVELGLLLAFVAWGLVWVALRRSGFIAYTVIAIVALWEGIDMIPTLTNGFVLIAIPAFLARLATVVALSSAFGLFLLMFHTSDEVKAPVGAPIVEDLDLEPGGAFESV